MVKIRRRLGCQELSVETQQKKSKQNKNDEKKVVKSNRKINFQTERNDKEAEKIIHPVQGNKANGKLAKVKDLESQGQRTVFRKDSESQKAQETPDPGFGDGIVVEIDVDEIYILDQDVLEQEFEQQQMGNGRGNVKREMQRYRNREL